MSGYNIKELVQEAQFRWLRPAEVLFILQNYEETQLKHEPPQKPPSGSLFLFNKRVLPFFRKDGHNWRRKKNGKNVGEAHERLKVGNDEALNCYYAHSEDNPHFRRRSYWMLNPEMEHIVLVHYRDTTILKRLKLEDGNKTDGKEVKLEDVGKQGKEEGSTSRPKEWQYLEISLEEIKQAAKNFQDCIGKGGYGLVYKGELYKSGKPIPVAIKRLNEQFGQGLKEFLTEIQLLSGNKHPNLVSLLGYCEEDKEKILVYEYARRGSLDQYLRRDTNYTLTWHQRLKICAGAARGLAHLHHHVGKHICIIHRDIKSSNILLDENWVAKISDFGLSKLSLAGLDRSIVISHPCGTMGYCEPEYMITGILSKESDVYSFGMVLFEVLCGRLCTIKDKDGILLSAHLAKEFYDRMRLEEIIDPRLKEIIDPSLDYVKRFSEIAYRCLHHDRKQRPPMDLVVKELEHLLEMEV